MALLALTAMVAPIDDKTFIDPHGSPIRAKDTGASASKSGLHIVHVRTRDVAAMTALGFRAATAADLNAGHVTSLTVNWSEDGFGG